MEVFLHIHQKFAIFCHFSSFAAHLALFTLKNHQILQKNLEKKRKNIPIITIKSKWPIYWKMSTVNYTFLQILDHCSSSRLMAKITQVRFYFHCDFIGRGVRAGEIRRSKWIYVLLKAVELKVAHERAQRHIRIWHITLAYWIFLMLNCLYNKMPLDYVF